MSASNPIRRLLIAGFVALNFIACGLVYEYDDLRGRPESVSASSASSGAGSGGSAGSGGEGPGGQCTSASSSGAGGCDSPNLDADPENCGACGHSCLGGNCNLGRCQPTQLGTIETAIAPVEIKLVGDYIYYLATDCYGRISKGGGTGSCMAHPPADDGFSKFALDDTGAYFTTKAGAVLVLRTGEEVAIPLLGPDALIVPNEVALDGANVYVNSKSAVVRLGKDNDVTGAGTVSLAPVYDGHALLLDGDNVFYTAAEGDAGAVGRVPKDGGLPICLLYTSPSPRDS